VDDAAEQTRTQYNVQLFALRMAMCAPDEGKTIVEFIREKGESSTTSTSSSRK
jgi:hypothetical protein